MGVLASTCVCKKNLTFVYQILKVGRNTEETYFHLNPFLSKVKRRFIESRKPTCLHLNSFIINEQLGNNKVEYMLKNSHIPSFFITKNNVFQVFTKIFHLHNIQHWIIVYALTCFCFPQQY